MTTIDNKSAVETIVAFEAFAAYQRKVEFYTFLGVFIGSVLAIALWVLLAWVLSLLGVPNPYLSTFGLWCVLQLAGFWRWLRTEKEFTRTIEGCLDKEPSA